jgi:hypothetical protein
MKMKRRMKMEARKYQGLITQLSMQVCKCQVK